VAAIPLAVASAGCGGSGLPANDDLRQAVAREMLCKPPGRVLSLHNSGLSCEQAGATLIVLAGGVEGPQTVRGAGGVWTCRDHRGPGRRPFLKCSQGERYFTAASETSSRHP
jgi:hypothetical protein